MKVAEIRGKSTPSYVLASKWEWVLSDLGTDLPDVIDHNTPALAKHPLWVRDQVLGAFRKTDLITANGETTELMRRLVRAKGQERQDVARELLANSYPSINVLNLRNATLGDLDRIFMDLGAGGSNVRRAVNFYLHLARQAGYTVGVRQGKRRKKGQTSKTQDIPTSDGVQLPLVDNDNTRTNGHRVSEELSMPQTETLPKPEPSTHEKRTFASEPEFNPAWPEDMQRAWLKAHLIHMELVMMERDKKPEI